MAKQFGINTYTVARKRCVWKRGVGDGLCVALCPRYRDVVLFIFSDARAHLVVIHARVRMCVWVARNINVYFSIYPTSNPHTHTQAP